MTDDTTSEDDSRPGLAGRGTELTYEIEAEERPSSAVVRTVASLTNTPVLDLEPLHEVVDPAHLDGICGRGTADRGTRTCTVSFEFAGCSVTVTGDSVRARTQAAPVE